MPTNSKAAQNKPAPESWRDVLPIHPAAELFPLMAETDPAALKELAEDIKKHGLRSPITLIKRDGKPLLLDGRNRLDALELAGFNLIEDGEFDATLGLKIGYFERSYVSYASSKRSRAETPHASSGHPRETWAECWDWVLTAIQHNEDVGRQLAAKLDAVEMVKGKPLDAILRRVRSPLTDHPIQHRTQPDDDTHITELTRANSEGGSAP